MYLGHSSGQASHTSRKIQSERNSPVGTCEQRDTGQGHPDKGTGHRSDDYLQNHVHFCWNGPGSSRRLLKSALRVWCREITKINH